MKRFLLISAICFVCFFLSFLAVGNFHLLFDNPLTVNALISLALAPIMSFFLIKTIFNIKEFEQGFQKLLEKMQLQEQTDENADKLFEKTQLQEQMGENADRLFEKTQLQKQMGENAANASLLCGVIGLFFVILAIVAIVQGRKAKTRGYKGGKATAGIALGIIAIIGWAAIIII